MLNAFNYSAYDRYKGKIAELPSVKKLEPKHLLNKAFRIEHAGNIEIYYAPVDCINGQAEIALVGITLGWHQMEVAFRTAREDILKVLGRVAVCRHAKRAAAFPVP